LTVFRRRSHFQPRRRFAPALTKNFGGGGVTGAAQGSSSTDHISLPIIVIRFKKDGGFAPPAATLWRV